MNKKLLAAVYQNPLFTQQELDEVIRAHKKISYKKGDSILREGQTAHHFLVVESGLLHAFVRDYNGNNITTTFFSSGSIVIEVASLFQRIATKENIQVLSDSVCYKIEFEDFQNLFHSLKSFREWGRAWLSNSLFQHKQHSVSVFTDTATERYLTLIKENPEVVKQAPLKHIASYLRITDSSLSRIRKEIAEKIRR